MLEFLSNRIYYLKGIYYKKMGAKGSHFFIYDK